MDKILEILTNCYQYDVDVLSQSWMYWLVLPACFYVSFMLVKWLILTCPIWIPISIVVRSIFRERESD